MPTQHILGRNQGTQYSGIPYLKISLNSVSYYSQCTIEPLYSKLIKEKPNKVNTFGAAYYDEAMDSGLPEKTVRCHVNWTQRFAI